MSFASETRERTRPVLPLAAMVDVLFLLLIFFITSSTLRQQETQVPLSLPSAETGEATVASNRVTISITDENRIVLEGREIAFSELRQRLERLASLSTDRTVVIRGDQGAAFGLAVQVLDLARSLGIEDATIATQRAEAP